MMEENPSMANGGIHPTTPTRRPYRRARAAHFLPASDGEMLYGSDRGIGRAEQRGRRRQVQGVGNEREEEDEEMVGDVEWLLDTRRWTPIGAEIDYTAFHRLSFRDKVSEVGECKDYEGGGGKVVASGASFPLRLHVPVHCSSFCVKLQAIKLDCRVAVVFPQCLFIVPPRSTLPWGSPVVCHPGAL
jgi:hypothetical protein